MAIDRTYILSLLLVAGFGVPGCGETVEDPEAIESDLIGGKKETNANVYRGVVRIGNGPKWCSGVYLGGGKIATAAHCFRDGAERILPMPYSSAVGVRWNASAERQANAEYAGEAMEYLCDVSSVSLRNPAFDHYPSFWTDDLAIVEIGDHCRHREAVDGSTTNYLTPLITRSKALGKLNAFTLPFTRTAPTAASGFGLRELIRGPQDLLNHVGFVESLALRSFTKIETRQKVTEYEHLFRNGLRSDDIASYAREHGISDTATAETLMGTAWGDGVWAAMNAGKLRCYEVPTEGKSLFFGDSGGPLYRIEAGRPAAVALFSHMYIGHSDTSYNGRVYVFCGVNLAPHASWIQTELAKPHVSSPPSSSLPTD
jgi:hypothetical protein